jgi:hypothetical protein
MLRLIFSKIKVGYSSYFMHKGQVENPLYVERFFYRVCQGLWPSLMLANEDIEPQNFWASSKSHVATTFLCMHFCSNYIGWSNQGKYYKIETHYAKHDVAT